MLEKENIKSSANINPSTTASTDECSRYTISEGESTSETLYETGELSTNDRKQPKSLFQPLKPTVNTSIASGITSNLSPHNSDHSHSSKFHDGEERIQHNDKDQVKSTCWRTFRYLFTDAFLIGRMHWVFRSNFIKVFLLFVLFYYIIILIFTSLIMLLVRVTDSCCFRVGGDNDPFAVTHFSIAFALSWTTFSTVGYGNVWPALSEDICGAPICVWAQLLLNIEAFSGIVFTGTFGAIIFAKVERILSNSQIKFSEVIVLRYGSGLGIADKAGRDGKDHDFDHCPVLEFRMMNLMHDKQDGEKMDNTVSCVASVHVLDASVPVLDATVKKTSDSKNRENIVPKRMFKEMKLTNPEHPFFKYGWTAVHVLDKDSPLLRQKMRKRLQHSGNQWPTKYNNIEKIRENLAFCQILVKYNGTSTITKSSTFAKTVYSRNDIIIGYKFVPLLTKNKSVKFAAELFNDVIEQDGDDPAENLGIYEDD